MKMKAFFREYHFITSDGIRYALGLDTPDAGYIVVGEETTSSSTTKHKQETITETWKTND